MAKQNKVETPEIDLQEQYGKAEAYINKNKNIILIGGAVLLALLLIVLWYTRIKLPGDEAAASQEMFKAQEYFANDEFEKALQGDGNYMGFLDIIDSYSGRTKAVNLANYYAGVSYLNQGNYQEAIDYLSNFKGNQLLGGLAKGAMGDAYMQLGDTENGIKHYKNAAMSVEDELSGGILCMKAGMAMEKQGDLKGAQAMYKRLKENYPNSDEGRVADKYLSRVEAQL